MLKRGISRQEQAARILGQDPDWHAEDAPDWHQDDADAADYHSAEDDHLHAEPIHGNDHPLDEHAPFPPADYPNDAAEQHEQNYAFGDDTNDAQPAADEQAEDHQDEADDASEWDDEPDDGDEDADERALVPVENGQALVPTTRLGGMLARLRGEPTDPALWRGPTPTAPLMILGKRRVMRPGALGHSPLALRAKRPRPFLMHIAVVLVSVLMLGGVAFASAPLTTQVQILSDINNAFAGSGAPPSNTQVQFHWYIVHDGDSLQSIANKFGVLPGGILEMNNLQDGDQLYVGMRLKIPTDKTYGASYQAQIDIPIPPPDKAGNVFGTNPWNSLSGATDPNNVCAPAGNADTQADRQLFQLIEPNPNASFARGWTWYHNGVDLDNPAGTPIHAAQSGMVVFGGWDNLGLGYSVKINHCNGLSTMYGHMRDFPLVHAGDYVQVGQIIGYEGSTGNSTGPHLHFMTEWWNKPANPYCFDFFLPAGNTPCQSS